MGRFDHLFSRALRNPGTVISFLFALPKNLRLLARLMGDSRVALLPKLLFLASLIYLVSPLDLIPDFVFPVIGWSDDLVIVFAAARNLIRTAPQDVLKEHIDEISAG